jgi:UDP-N-acetylmuramate: L-alanyl-gamma-D-glutamyl-meso-diaminopimelate ligase
MKDNPKHIHFIAIGGAAMHNLALALYQRGYIVTGSDDEILEPSRTRLANSGLLPEKEGWYPEKITSRLGGVILGMHARADNPELLAAQSMGIPVYSYPEYLYEHSKDKKRIVIGGSHGKTSITAMILHVLKACNVDFDYMVGAKLEGFDTMVRLSNAPIIVLEGDEYLSSAVDRRPKFHLYRAEIGLISGIAWDHINVFPTYDNYVEQFRIFADNIPADGKLIYCEEDAEADRVVKQSKTSAEKISYKTPPHSIRNGKTFLDTVYGEVEINVFGKHNLMNLEGARLVCNTAGIIDEIFYKNIGSFKGAARRLELLGKNDDITVYKDFAHSPSKLKATVEAVRMQFPERKLVACMELHTFSSLSEQFLDEYKSSMDQADLAMVYYNPHTIEHKKLKAISAEMVKKSFGNKDAKIYTDSAILQKDLLGINSRQTVYLLMSSGNFDGISLEELTKKIISNSESFQSTS